MPDNKIEAESSWGWALLERNGPDDPTWRVDIHSIRRTRREVIAYALRGFQFSDVMYWSSIKRKYRLRVERVEVTAHFFGKTK